MIYDSTCRSVRCQINCFHLWGFWLPCGVKGWKARSTNLSGLEVIFVASKHFDALSNLELYWIQPRCQRRHGKNRHILDTPGIPHYILSSGFASRVKTNAGDFGLLSSATETTSRCVRQKRRIHSILSIHSVGITEVFPR